MRQTKYITSGGLAFSEDNGHGKITPIFFKGLACQWL